MIAIADGVSSIKNSGINVGNFSNELLKKCLNLYLHRCVNSALFEKQNRVVFDHYSIKHKEEDVLKPIVCRSACSSNFLGASTLLLSSVEKEKLHICTIGDCQMLILRLRKNCLQDKRIRAVQSNMGTNQHLGNSSKRESALADTLQDGTYADMCNGPPDEETSGDPLDATEEGFKSMRYNSPKRSALSTPRVSSSKKDALDHTAQGSKFKLKELYAQRKELYKKDLFREGSGGKAAPHNHESVTLYMEEELTDDICEQFEAYLADKNYKIRNLTFVVKEEEDDCPHGATPSDTITGSQSNTKTGSLQGHKYSHTTESDWYENENQPLSTVSTMDESGYRNLLRFFDLDRTDILAIDNGEDYRRCVGERPTEGNHHLEVGTAMNRSWSEEYRQKGTQVNHFNNYRFRCFDMDKNRFDIIYKSKVQQHYFNCPFQITFMPATLGGCVERKESNRGTRTVGTEGVHASKLGECSRVKMSTYNDIISKCIRYCEYATADVKNNDIIVSGSDGLFDNLYDDDIMEILFNNFYTVKCNEFVQLKEIYNFYDECSSVLRKVKDTISGDWHKGRNPERTFSGVINQSSDVDVNTDHGEELKWKGKPNEVGDESPGTHRSEEKHHALLSLGEENNKGKNAMKGRVHKSEIIPDGKQKEEDGEMDGKGKNADLLSGNINSFDYTRGRRNKENASENNWDEQRKKEKERNYFFSKKYKSNISTAMLRLKFPSKIKRMFSMRTKGGKSGKGRAKSEIGESERGKDLPKAEKNRNEEQHQETGTKPNLQEAKMGAYNPFVQKKKIDYGKDNSSCSGHSGGSLNRKDLSIGAYLKKDDHLGSPSASDAYSDDNMLDNEGNSRGVCNSNAQRKIHEPKGVDNFDNPRGEDCGFTNGPADWSGNASGNPTDFVLFDENNNIYLNTKKACDEIVQLSSILANQEVNKTLLRKRRKKYDAHRANMNSKEKDSVPDNAHMCDALGKIKNDKHPSRKAPPTIYEKETHLFDKVNYDDIQSNKSREKIILTPISEFIFDKYKKYFNMGKPDDITVVLSVVKENKYS
ncbi:protein serine/threonine phosphatase 2C [Plasmodium cynomolgi strain B]|uniref:Protein serine/threonine phosphatase 2C n=1 Tax=Plasmodium cynomolgi (strain B) TaxID=1120755 RepID=K6UP94_PLACD|nr:protein serine/threonine phosphatase 2C [Plasmodium cynomolgi strain B]GAB64389.1 protein serine/threonine phosphatase 2C [Plasmodium cynomolgi strain B]